MAKTKRGRNQDRRNRSSEPWERGRRAKKKGNPRYVLRSVKDKRGRNVKRYHVRNPSKGRSPRSRRSGSMKTEKPASEIQFKVPADEEGKFETAISKVVEDVGGDAYYSDPDNYYTLIIRPKEIGEERKARAIAKKMGIKISYVEK